MPRSKRYQAISKKIEKNKVYPIAEAIKIIKDTATIKFDSSIEVHVKTGIDASKGEQQIRGSITLPHGTGKTKKIAAFVDPEKEKEAKEAGAEVVGGAELIDKIKQTGKIDFELAVATPSMMKNMAVIAKILGPRGLMPSPKNETISVNIKKTIGELKKGKVNFKSDSTGNIHQSIGKASFSPDQLLENYNVLVQAVKKAKPAAAKGNYLQNITLSSTMGPGLKVAIDR
ncbi:MAG: 50S ribosomal protein L1 [Candidatus Buchananbacteria bacterium RIFCSPLOWO2_01_FULL_46_12]|uniref:Large ribosomal subunit protein uL1 n=2 Tax=Candidatus Buchananiibacteriota TaxID=1817903 RepID=A0A1G1YMA3_9BACT|nr:MAG: 50S ribosomal protein L1 [Candidatus Buchananbacteria bacterium RIFCSPHIGHO2_01_FULL_44_11]OGY53478.1 MAG: 50S ribosomal protein L1 [Candidatus Buchananbacteria bacterium RIFCSPLOWO2_01_FULL_46_12]